MTDLRKRVDGYFKKARLKFDSAKILSDSKEAKVLWNSASNYFEDANHFYEQGDLVSALGALEYAEGFLDAARKLGLVESEHTGELD